MTTVRCAWFLTPWLLVEAVRCVRTAGKRNRWRVGKSIALNPAPRSGDAPSRQHTINIIIMSQKAIAAVIKREWFLLANILLLQVVAWGGYIVLVK